MTAGRWDGGRLFGQEERSNVVEQEAKSVNRA